MKVYDVSVFFPELPSYCARQRTRQSGSSMAVAVGRALDDVLRRDGVKRRHITTAQITVALIEQGDTKPSSKPRLNQDAKPVPQERKVCFCTHGLNEHNGGGRCEHVEPYDGVPLQCGCMNFCEYEVLA